LLSKSAEEYSIHSASLDGDEYGLYCPALSKQEGDDAVEFQRSMQKDGGFYLARVEGIGRSPNEDINIEEWSFVYDSAEQYFMNCCSQYAGQDFPDLGSAVEYLHS
jgi:hypothetical protein